MEKQSLGEASPIASSDVSPRCVSCSSSSSFRQAICVPSLKTTCFRRSILTLDMATRVEKEAKGRRRKKYRDRSLFAVYRRSTRHMMAPTRKVADNRLYRRHSVCCCTSHPIGTYSPMIKVDTSEEPVLLLIPKDIENLREWILCTATSTAADGFFPIHDLNIRIDGYKSNRRVRTQWRLAERETQKRKEKSSVTD